MGLFDWNGRKPYLAAKLQSEGLTEKKKKKKKLI